jgi:hypothetical protein
VTEQEALLHEAFEEARRLEFNDTDLQRALALASGRRHNAPRWRRTVAIAAGVAGAVALGSLLAVLIIQTPSGTPPAPATSTSTIPPPRPAPNARPPDYPDVRKGSGVSLACSAVLSLAT